MTEHLVLILWPEVQREALSPAQQWRTLCLSSDLTQAPPKPQTSATT